MQKRERKQLPFIGGQFKSFLVLISQNSAPEMNPLYLLNSFFFLCLLSGITQLTAGKIYQEQYLVLRQSICPKYGCQSGILFTQLMRLRGGSRVGVESGRNEMLKRARSFELVQFSAWCIERKPYNLLLYCSYELSLLESYQLW